MSKLYKFIIKPMKQRSLATWVTQKQVEKWIENWRVFFILGFGRSGTAFLANLLNQAQEAYVFHEPVLEDFYAHLKAHYDSGNAERYMQGFRKKEIYVRTHHLSPAVYGEVNGNLRCHAEAIKIAFPNVALIHLVRDGRDVVRSTMPRRMMTLRNPLSMMMHPEKSDSWKSSWSEMDRFARICWYWQEENRRLRTTIGETVQFEKILTSYEYFSSKVLEPCGLQINKKDWKAAVASPRNATREFSMPKWDQWTPEQQKTFSDICGEEMGKCGYSF